MRAHATRIQTGVGAWFAPFHRRRDFRSIPTNTLSVNGAGNGFARPEGLATESVNWRVLVLNLDYRPLNICNVRRAFSLLLNGKAEIVEQYADDLVSAEARYTRPSVIKLHYLVKRPPTGPRLVRQEVFRRDGHMCQYCGVQTRELTIDHVMPRHRGGGHTWENLVAACKDCNHRKGGRTAEEARMRLLASPAKHRQNGYLAHLRNVPASPHKSWVPFLYPTGKPT